jgi:hypothetical protein
LREERAGGRREAGGRQEGQEGGGKSRRGQYLKNYGELGAIQNSRKYLLKILNSLK